MINKITTKNYLFMTKNLLETAIYLLMLIIIICSIINFGWVTIPTLIEYSTTTLILLLFVTAIFGIDLT